MGANRDALQRYSFAVISHLLLVLAWYLFVELGHVPKFVMPSPYETLRALLVPNYRWPENIAVTSVEIFGGYVLAVVVGIALALVFTWSRWLEMATMPLLVSLNMIPKVALGPLIIVWFKYGIGPNIMMAFAICFFPIVLTTARGLREVEQFRLNLAQAARGREHDRKEADGERHHDVGPDAVLEPDDDKRTECDLGDHVEADQERHGRHLEPARPGEHERQRNADHHRQHIPTEDLNARDRDVFGPAVVRNQEGVQRFVR